LTQGSAEIDKKARTRKLAEALLKEYFAGKSPEEIVSAMLAYLEQDKNFNDEDILALLSHTKNEQETMLPVTLFSIDALSPLEVVVKYLKERKNLAYHTIGKLLGRDDRVIWATYKKAANKHPAELVPEPTPFLMPATMLADSPLSVLETVVVELHDHHKLNFAQIARLLKRNDRTIWTVYNRAGKKRGAQ
jgi:hypothetical protein